MRLSLIVCAFTSVAYAQVGEQPCTDIDGNGVVQVDHLLGSPTAAALAADT